VKDVEGWMERNLDVQTRPDAEMVWNRRVKQKMGDGIADTSPSNIAWGTE